ncbi:UbiC transcription regulator-associated domain-containing protein [Ketogulonicigenium vulgare Y25]|uniref:Transcriptional regulator protein n=1 Tax=Ketogulonicigenium vulgare (strain WSH-001) TaxID=759362 RepID=F9Y4W3_KETVW|nr:GntR family transcriptional regulator [Ketogulonicigenium vulgare]ADO43571.1 UbiC transcription regulator-associated domain-containing protein [Ketogulonicigenium vulgare Y25]AEM41847.1 transcriptional regulator protein [Ketogulonicigenium vulgare WSH-001]ALJ81953.1 phage tail protein [Ketogulonicigenium vulgare]AOZ55605.1 UbiC transcription regulator-associated domain-containing protein [Ketogulonicigenium vulgare]
MNYDDLNSAMASQSADSALYLRLARAIRDLVRDGRLHPGDPLPPERDLASNTGVSRVTVRKALAQLIATQEISSQQGSGNFITQAPATEPMQVGNPLLGGSVTLRQARLPSFTEVFRNRGLAAESIWMARALHAPTTEELMTLGLDLSEKVARLERVRWLDGRPIGVERSSLPASILPDPMAVTDSLYAQLDALGAAPVRAIQRISAANITPRDAATLGILPGAAVLRIERTAYLQSGRVAELSRAIYRADAYDVVTELKSVP